MRLMACVDKDFVRPFFKSVRLPLLTPISRHIPPTVTLRTSHAHRMRSYSAFEALNALHRPFKSTLTFFIQHCAIPCEAME